MQKYLIVALVLIPLGLIVFLTSVVLRTSTGESTPFDYGIVLDAGSSHTSVYLYKWLADQVNNTGVVSEVKSCETDSGIDDREDDTDGTLADLLPCVRNITSLIELRNNDTTQIYLGATAGMRLLNITKPKTAKIIFLEIENSFLRLRDEGKPIDVKDIRILTGREEAQFGWVTTNYLLKVFPKFGSTTSEPNSGSFGMLDMGGASAQIAYETYDENFKKSKDVVKVRLYGHDYYLRGESNLCFGSDEVFARYRFLQLLSDPARRRFNDPCYLKGSEISVKAKKIFTVCTETLPVVPKVAHSEDDEYTFVGTFNKEQCANSMLKLFDTTYCERTFQRCFIEEKTAPPESMTFYGLSSYYYVTSALRNATDKRTTFTYDEYNAEMNKFCSQDHSQLADKFSKKELKFAVNYCFQLRYILLSLENIYKFNVQKQIANINFVQKISNESLGWALGFMINATNLIPPEVPSKPILSTTMMVFLIIVGLIIFFIGCYFVMKWRKSKESMPTDKDQTVELNKV